MSYFSKDRLSLLQKKGIITYWGGSFKQFGLLECLFTIYFSVASSDILSNFIFLAFLDVFKKPNWDKTKLWAFLEYLLPLWPCVYINFSPSSINRRCVNKKERGFSFNLCLLICEHMCLRINYVTEVDIGFGYCFTISASFRLCMTVSCVNQS